MKKIWKKFFKKNFFLKFFFQIFFNFFSKKWEKSKILHQIFLIFIFSGPHIPIGNICNGISSRHDDSFFLALEELCATLRTRRYRRPPASVLCFNELLPRARRRVFSLPGAHNHHNLLRRVSSCSGGSAPTISCSGNKLLRRTLVTPTNN